jgi:putative acetyltransferase
MISFKRTDSTDSDLIALVKRLDSELAIRDGELHKFYSQFNSVVDTMNIIVAYADDQPAGCGAIKKYAPGACEVKRMFVAPEHRRKGIAASVLSELEKWAVEQAYSKCILETGINQPEAVALYHKSGYTRIPNYDQYIDVEESLCFEKLL